MKHVEACLSSRDDEKAVFTAVETVRVQCKHVCVREILVKRF